MPATALNFHDSEDYVRAIHYKNADAPHHIAASFRENGFAVLKNHPISQSLLKDVLEEWQAFFDLNEVSKNHYIYDHDSFIGYYPLGIENAKGAYEKNAMEYYHHEPHFPLPPSFSNKTNILFQELARLAHQILKGLYDALPLALQAKLPGPLHDIMGITSPTSLMRIMHYPPITDDTTTRNVEHEDINLITLLSSATAPGLQVKDKNGQWHDVGYATEDIIINAGDMLHLLTEGYYQSTTHRVISPKGENAHTPRYSIPLFIGAQKNVILRPQFTAYDYLMERLLENGIVQKKTTASLNLV